MKHLLDAPLLWRQLDGPQANALLEGARAYVKSWLLSKLSYFRSWSLETARGKHIDFIGLLMGVGRPKVLSKFYFDYALKYDGRLPPEADPLGYSNAPPVQYPDNPGYGGVFDFKDPAQRPIEAMVDMGDYDYRNLLQLINKSPYEVNSYLFLDEMCHHYAGADYTLSSALGVIGGARQEDILVNLTVYNEKAYIGIRAIAEYYIVPFPRIFINMVPENQGP